MSVKANSAESKVTPANVRVFSLNDDTLLLVPLQRWMPNVMGIPSIEFTVTTNGYCKEESEGDEVRTRQKDDVDDSLDAFVKRKYRLMGKLIPKIKDVGQEPRRDHGGSLEGWLAHQCEYNARGHIDVGSKLEAICQQLQEHIEKGEVAGFDKFFGGKVTVEVTSSWESRIRTTRSIPTLSIPQWFDNQFLALGFITTTTHRSGRVTSDPFNEYICKLRGGHTFSVVASHSEGPMFDIHHILMDALVTPRILDLLVQYHETDLTNFEFGL